MKHLVDFNLTEQEIQQIFGSQEDYEYYLNVFAKNPISEKIRLC